MCTEPPEAWLLGLVLSTSLTPVSVGLGISGTQVCVTDTDLCVFSVFPIAASGLDHRCARCQLGKPKLPSAS